MKLDFIIPHYNEPFEVGKRFFETLALQRGADFSEIRVLLIHDGSEMFPEETFKDYPFVVEQHKIAHKGVSAARNYGLDMAKAKWVSFCDFDDFYTDVYALKVILESLETDDFDLLWNAIYMEDYKDGKFKVYPMPKFNMIFIHNKYIRREFLLETGLRFNEKLEYSEDSSFLAVLNILLEQNRIGKIVTASPLYTWAYRIGSCTTSKENKKRNVEHLFRANRYIAREFDRLKYPDAVLMRFRAVCDVYNATTKEPEIDFTELLIKTAVYWKANKEEISKQDRKSLQKVLDNSVKTTRHGVPVDVERPSFAEWIKGLDKYTKG